MSYYHRYYCARVRCCAATTSLYYYHRYYCDRVRYRHSSSSPSYYAPLLVLLRRLTSPPLSGSYARRAWSIKALDHLCSSGAPLSDISPLEDADLAHVDLGLSSNVLALTLVRRVVRSIGRRFHLRIDLYSMNTFVVAISTSALLYLQMVGNPEGLHQTVAQHAILWTSSLTACFLLATTVVAAEACNHAERHRSTLQRQCVVASGRLVDSAAAKDPSRCWEATAHRDLLVTADEICGYEEEISDPTTVLGVKASPVAVSSVLSVIAAILAASVQGMVALLRDDWEYEADGGFRPGR